MLHIGLSDDKLVGLLQFIKFGIVGISNTVISYVLNILVLLAMKPLEASWDFIAGNVVSFVLSVLWSFYWNNRFVFVVRDGEQRKIGKALFKTYLSYGFTGIILNNIFSWLWISVIGISKYISPLINLIISVPLNFSLINFGRLKRMCNQIVLLVTKDIAYSFHEYNKYSNIQIRICLVSCKVQTKQILW